jgi:hypothetical protein
MIVAGFLNDISIDTKGVIYYTDTSPGDPEASTVCTVRNGIPDTLANEPIDRANGILCKNGSVLVGNSGDLTLKEIDLKKDRVNNVARLDTGVIDGIKLFDRNRYLVSHWEGKLYMISARGKVTLLLDTREEKINIADFEFVGRHSLLVIPTFTDYRIIAYRIEQN